MISFNDSTPVGFIGTGVMGRSMAGHILAAGHPLAVFTRTRKSAEGLLARGARWAATPAEAAASSEVVITMVGYPTDVEQVYLGPAGILEGARRESVLIDMTTSSPALAERLFAAAAARGCASLDAPVSGGDVGAREARLSIMVGGDREAFDAMAPLFALLGRPAFQGGAGAGQHTKMANQIAIASGMVGVCEALSYAKRAGLDPTTVLSSIEKGAAGSWSLSNLGPRMLSGDFAPGFYVKHFLKDMRIALDSARSMRLETPGLALAESLYERLAGAGGAELGTQALYKLFENG